jgi:serine/threonine protein phosphatase PrpC
LAKKLRLAAAGLTDVGRRREHNQDNVTHYVPPDENELAAKGALFVVCDGMGGHAAGEVASELGVNAIRDVYYASNEEDVIDNIASAIRSANDSIYEYAQQHPESKGMGTTCVSVLIHGGRAYFVNIGDSRGYLVRDGDMRQVTLDHSWVAEQVRAGLLSEEQARTHAHRNVITRSLGTGPRVTADLFVESLKQGDRILLCSDGLHGYVDEREIKREMLTLSEPEAGVQALVDMANSNGGPDNITALVIHLLEVPPVTGELNLPVAGSQDEQTITQPVPAVPASAARASKVASIPHKAYSAKLPVADLTKNKSRTGNPVAALSIRLLAIAAVLVILAGVWDITLGPYAQMHAATQQLQSTISHARQVVSRSGQLDPASALSTLSQARAQLVTGLENAQVDPQVRQSAQQLLNTQVASAVQNAVNRYDTAALIMPITSSAPAYLGHRSVSCSTPTSQSPVPLNAISALVAVTPTGLKPNSPPAATQTLYTISSGLLYQMVVPADTSTGRPTLGTVTCTQLAVQSVSSVLALASDGETLFVLAQQNPTTYEVLIYSPNGTSPTGQPLLKAVAHFGVPTTGGTVPALIAAKGSTTYVSYSNTGGAPGIWIFTGTKPTKPAKTIPLNQAAHSIVATNNTLYTILADGSLGQLDSQQAFQPIQVAIQPPLIPSTPTNYTSATPVPTVANTSATGGSSGNTTFRGDDVIAADADDSTTIYIEDTAQNRVVRFSASGTGPGLGLADQFTYGGSIPSFNQLALAANGTVLNVYGWSGSQLASFSVDEPKSGS